MITTQTPLRISLVGGGTDLPSFFGEHGPGRVVSFAIDKYVYIMVNKKFDGKVRVSYSVTEIAEAAGAIHHELARECLKRLGIRKGIEVVSIADVPGRGTGLGSSSAYTVGLLNALSQHRVYNDGEEVEPVTDVAEEACYIEIDRCRKPIGYQDQYAVAYGGLNKITFEASATPGIERISLEGGLKEAMEDHMLLFYTGETRLSKEILTKQSQLRDPKKIGALKDMAEAAESMATDLKRGSLEKMGFYLHFNWILKKSLVDSISDPRFDAIYNKAMDAGATGGKLCGAGGGGFFLFWAPPDCHEDIKKAVGLQYVPFKIDPHGTRLYGGIND